MRSQAQSLCADDGMEDVTKDRNGFLPRLQWIVQKTSHKEASLALTYRLPFRSCNAYMSKPEKLPYVMYLSVQLRSRCW